MNLRYFDVSEFDSPDDPGSAEENMDEDFLRLIDQIRHRCGFAFVVNSGYRSNDYNEQIGGSEDSAHTRGTAADIRVEGSRQRYFLVKEALNHGVTRIGIGDGFVHIDNDEQNDQEVIWLYS